MIQCLYLLGHLTMMLKMNIGRVSIQGVKSLWGDRIVFPRLGTRDTDRWHINLSVSSQTDLTPWILTLKIGICVKEFMTGSMPQENIPTKLTNV